MAAHSESIQFQKAVFRAGAIALRREIADGFPFLGNLHSGASIEAIKTIKSMPADTYDLLASAMPKRGKPQELLAALGEELNSQQQHILAMYEKARAQRQLEQHVANDSVVREINQVQRASYLEGRMSPFAGRVERQQKSGGIIVFCKPMGSLTVRTYIDFKKKSARVSYSHHVLNAAGEQLNGFPLSILEAYGISSVTAIDLSDDGEFEISMKDLDTCIQASLDLISKVSTAAG